MEIPFALAFTAGLVATVNPCGFAMLPAYLSYFVGLDDAGRAGRSIVGRAFLVGGVVSAGFLTVFGAAGVLITLGVQLVIDALPWAAMVVGVGIAVLGVAMLAGFELRARLPQLGVSRDGRQLRGVFLFGTSYAIASLSCTLPVFLVVVAGAIPQLGFVAGVLTFLIYGLGMSALLMVVTLAVALGEQAIVGRLRRAGRHINRVAGAILILAGAYIVFFWTTTLIGDGTAQLAPIVQVELASARITNWIRARPVEVGIGAAALLGTAAVVSRRLWFNGAGAVPRSRGRR